MKRFCMIFTGKTETGRALSARRILFAAALTLLGVGIGLLSLLLTAYADASLAQRALFYSYFSNVLLLALNLLPAILSVWLGYFLFGRCWCGVLLSGLLCVGLPLVNYYKIALRGDPMLGSDLLLAKTAAGILDRYTIEITKPVAFSLAMLVVALFFAAVFLRRGRLRPRLRLLGCEVCVLLALGLYFGAYTNEAVYEKTANDALVNAWSDTEVFVSRGFAVSFLRSIPDMFPEEPEDYDKPCAQELLAQFSDADIPEERKVSVMGVMLEAFCDLTDFAALRDEAAVQEVYAPWHALEKQSLSGDLYTNIFAGGTVDSEWCFLTGESQYDDFRSDVDSYVRYFTAQGYATHYTHPGYNWIYSRKTINEYLGFEQSVFTENGFGELVDPVVAAWHSDRQLVDYLLRDLDAAEGTPLFSFAVSYQNHGPYGADSYYQQFVSEEGSGLSTESCNILNNYLYGIQETICEYVRLTEELEQRDTPVVLVLFGDHKPWLGNNNSVYADMRVDFDVSAPEGFRNYYATPYLIWANSAAQEVLGSDFCGAGGEFSPCFLMMRLFDACGWEGPDFMQFSRAMREVSPLVHQRELFLSDGVLTSVLDDTDRAVYEDFLNVQYYREHNYSG